MFGFQLSTYCRSFFSLPTFHFLFIIQMISIFGRTIAKLLSHLCCTFEKCKILHASESHLQVAALTDFDARLNIIKLIVAMHFICVGLFRGKIYNVETRPERLFYQTNGRNVLFAKVNRFCPAQNLKMSHWANVILSPAEQYWLQNMGSYSMCCCPISNPPNSFNFQNVITLNTWTTNRMHLNAHVFVPFSEL